MCTEGLETQECYGVFNVYSRKRFENVCLKFHDPGGYVVCIEGLRR